MSLINFQWLLVILFCGVSYLMFEYSVASEDFLKTSLKTEESLEKLCCGTSLCYAEQNPGSEVGLSVSDRLHAHGGVLGDPSPSIGAGLLPWSGHGRELSGASLGSLPSAGASVAGSAKPPGCEG